VPVLSIPILSADSAGEKPLGGSQRKANVICAGVRYLLKLPTEERTHPWVTFNELLGAFFAKAASFEVPPCAMVEIPPDLAVLNDIDEVVAPGLYFGSLWLGDYQTLDETFVSDMSEAARDALYNVLALDLVIYNVDRKFPDVLCSDGGARDGKLALIDHGNALGGANWNLASLKKLETAQLPARDCRLIYHLLVDENRAKAGAERVAAAIEPQLWKRPFRIDPFSASRN
jgi:hypothetical protein